MSRRDYFPPLFQISFKVRADDEERRFDIFFIQYRKNLIGYARRRAIIESQRDGLLPRVYARHDVAEELERSGLADLECGGRHGDDRDNDRQRSLHTFTDHLLFSDESAAASGSGRGSYDALIGQAAFATARGADSRIDLTVLQLSVADTTTAIFHDQDEADQRDRTENR